MALPQAAPDRQFKHRRSIDVQIYAQGQGLWEVEARLVDTKTRSVLLAGSVRDAGTPIDEMLLRLNTDERLNFVEAGFAASAMPYPGASDRHGEAYGRLVGPNLMRGFRQVVKKRLDGVLGCTHLTELSQVLPTAVVRAYAGDVIDAREDGPGGEPPFQINRCHALRADGPSVQSHYPRWYRPTQRDNLLYPV